MHLWPVIRAATVLVVITFGVFSVADEVCFNAIPISLLLITILTAFVYWTHVACPAEEVVEAVVGKNFKHLDVDALTKSELSSIRLMKTVAHRGAGLDAPENSLPAFQLCAEKGCGYVEFDVILTADNIPVVFHDSSMERITNEDKFISNLKYEELQQVDVSIKHIYKERFMKTGIPTLAQTVEQLLGSNQNMFIDVKNNDKRIIDIILDLFDKHTELYSRAIVSSFYPYVIYNVRKRNPKIVCSLAWRPHVIAYDQYGGDLDMSKHKRSSKWYRHYWLCFLDVIYEWLLHNVLYYYTGISMILLHKDCLSPKVVSEWERKGLRVVAWTVNHPVEKQYCTRVLKITYMTDTLTGEASVHCPH